MPRSKTGVFCCGSALLVTGTAVDSTTGTAPAFVLSVALAIWLEAQIHRARGACQAITAPFAVGIAIEHGLPGGLFRLRIERRQPLAGCPFEHFREFVRVVGDQFGPVMRD